VSDATKNLAAAVQRETSVVSSVTTLISGSRSADQRDLDRSARAAVSRSDSDLNLKRKTEGRKSCLDNPLALHTRATRART
jgi:hypothetical protein